MKVMLCLMLCLVCHLLVGQSKIFNNKALIAEIKTGVDEMYNYKYDKSLQLFLEIGKKVPGHPVGPMLLALNAFWKYSPIEENPKEYAQYKKDTPILMPNVFRLISFPKSSSLSGKKDL